MPAVKFVGPDGSACIVDAKVGDVLKDVAKGAKVDGILAECGGNCACATCHVYVDENWIEAAGAPAELEAAMLEFAYEPRKNSRLSCQMRMTEALDGLVLHLPTKQGLD